jgi:hypothetical protein
LEGVENELVIGVGYVKELEHEGVNGGNGKASIDQGLDDTHVSVEGSLGQD